MSAEPVLVELTEILRLSRQMLDYAKSDAWPDFLSCADERQKKIDWMMQQVWPAADWSEPQRDAGEKLLTELLHYNTDIGVLAGEWHTELKNILTHARLASRVSSAYAGSAE
jgi:hypothetical protein